MPQPSDQPSVLAKVLVVDDDKTNLTVIRLLLARRGVQVDLASDGQTAIAKALTHDYSAILMDCHMPELDGWEATRQIRAAETDRRTPIIAVTATDLPADRERAAAVGMDDFFTKPVRIAHVDEILHRWVLADNAPTHADPTGP